MLENKEKICSIILATGNAHKIREISQILSGIPFLTLEDFEIKSKVEENGSSFFENAKIKAKHYYKMLQKQGAPEPFAVLSEDSGLCVDALGGAPGILSSRYGMDRITEKEQKEDPYWQLSLLLKEMQGKLNRKARFICSALLYLQHETLVFSQAIWEGEIIQNMAQGMNGFGYDPIFYLPAREKSSAELSSEEKNTLSHRARALKALRPVLEHYIEK